MARKRRGKRLTRAERARKRREAQGRVTDTTGESAHGTLPDTARDAATPITETTVEQPGGEQAFQPAPPVRYGEGDLLDERPHVRRRMREFKEYMQLGIFTPEQVDAMIGQMALVVKDGTPREKATAMRVMMDIAKEQRNTDAEAGKQGVPSQHLHIHQQPPAEKTETVQETIERLRREGRIQ